MNELSLFSGAGGGLLGTSLLGFRCVGYVEKDEFCQKVLAQRMREGNLDPAPIFSDIRTFISEGYAGSYTGLVDLVTAGWPCQRYSSAARGRNNHPDLWPETFTVIQIVRPREVLLENVSEARDAMAHAANQLRELGYSSKRSCLSASSLGAPYIGRRLWLRAKANREGEPASAQYVQVAELPKASSPIWTDIERTDLGVANGSPNRMERLKAVGNAQIPRMVVEAWRRLAPER